MDQSEVCHSSQDGSVTPVKHLNEYNNDCFSNPDSRSPHSHRNGSFKAAQVLEGDDMIKASSGYLQGNSPISPLDYHMSQNVGLGIASSPTLECDDFTPIQLENAQTSDSTTGEIALRVNPFYVSGNLLTGEHPGGDFLGNYNADLRFPILLNSAPASASFPSIEGYWSSLGCSAALPPYHPDTRSPDSFSRVPALADGGASTSKSRVHDLRDSQLETRSFPQTRVRRCTDLQRSGSRYGLQRISHAAAGKSTRDPRTRHHHPYGYRGQALLPDINPPDMSLKQYSTEAPYSNIENKSNNTAGYIPPDRRIPSVANLDVESKESSSSLPFAFAGNVAHQYLNEDSIGDLNVVDILNCIAARPNPEINLGAIDMSCAFVISRVTAYDFPIMYVSDEFQRLTGYSKEEVVGRDCRFLQEPTRSAKTGSNCSATDDRVISRLKSKISAGYEAQECLINYRKGGQPFLNLITVIPIRRFSNEHNLIVGFQLDLVDCPQSVTGRNHNGSYLIDYRRKQPAPDIYDSGGTAGSQDGNNFPQSRNSSNVDLDDVRDRASIPLGNFWDKALLESRDFLFYIMSTSGVFFYVARTASTILEYEPQELSGSTLSSICHPSDIVTVLRELRHSEPGSNVNLLYRIRRKTSGYAWFESLGSVYLEPMKQQRHVVLMGKILDVISMSPNELMEGGGISEGEIWTKISTYGTLLFVSSSVSVFLDKRPEDMVGESVQSLLSGESQAVFKNALGVARSGKRVSCKNELQHRGGHLLPVQSTIHPGEKTNETSRPTFLLLQIRLLKLGKLLFGCRTTAAPTRIRRKGSGGTMMRRPTISPEMLSPPGLIDKSYGDQNIRASFCYSSHTRQQAINHSVIEPGPTTIPAHNKRSSTTFLLNNREQEKSREITKQDANIFLELTPTRATNWQMELEHLKRRNRQLAEELQYLTTLKKRKKRKRDAEILEKDCSQCHTKITPEWRRGPSGNRDLCNSCGLRWAKQVSIHFEFRKIFTG
ncbi:hypothetical protein AJ79_04190 [Helicocarpus griseus UAMH5409]|uniref:White collar 1 protein n=1 Tax=Helicocarpus griseus UAMH5409 TaxID=1447875 RepID=A0A2B7XUC3_9EURO|nr:hypothetical protein AJ79_04190 [Helicocarpus griseus UAMH5409]